MAVKMPQACGAFSRQQRRAVELHDSKLLAVREDAGEVRVLLSAYVHVSAGEPGRDSGTGWSQDVELVLSGATVEGRPPELPLWITEGALSVNAPGDEANPTAPEAAAGLFALPFDRAGAVRLALAGAEGTLTVRAASVVAVPRGDPEFIERVPRREA